MDIHKPLFLLYWFSVSSLGEATNSSTGFLIMGTTPHHDESVTSIIKYYPATGHIERIPVELYSYVTTTGYDSVNDRIYWGNFAIVSANPEGQKQIHVSSEEQEIYTGVAIDPVRQLLYYSNPLKGSIVALNVSDKDHVATDFMSDIESPWQIALDLKNQFVYWASYNHIERASMDGTEREKVYSKDRKATSFFTAVYIDTQKHRLYTCEVETTKNPEKTSVLIEVNLEDFGFRTTQVPLECLSLAGNSTHLYVVNHEGVEAVFTKRKDQLLQKSVSWEIMINNVTVPFPNGLFYVGNTTEVAETATCSLSCEDNQVCLYTTTHSRCSCKTGSNGDQCSERDFRRTIPSILQSQETQLYGALAMPHQMMNLKQWNFFRFINDFRKPGALAIDTRKKQVYANFPQDKSTYVADLNNMADSPSHEWTKLPFFNYACNGMTYDWEAGTLICTVNASETHSAGIVAASVSSGYEKWIYSDNTSKPHAVSVDPQYGYIYWTDLADNTVKKMIGDGRSLITPIKFGPSYEPKTLALDYINEKIFIGAGGLIYEYSYDEKLEQRYPVPNITMTGLDVYPPYFVYSGYDGGSQGLRLMNYVSGDTTTIHYEGLRDVAILHESRQPKWELSSDCHAGCSICLSVPLSIKCLCSEDNSKCTESTTTPSTTTKSVLTSEMGQVTVPIIAAIAAGGVGLLLIAIIIGVLVRRKQKNEVSIQHVTERQQSSPNEYKGKASTDLYKGLQNEDRKPSPSPSKSTIYIHFTAVEHQSDEAPTPPPRPNFMRTSDYESLTGDRGSTNPYDNPDNDQLYEEESDYDLESSAYATEFSGAADVTPQGFINIPLSVESYEEPVFTHQTSTNSDQTDSYDYAIDGRPKSKDRVKRFP